MKQIDGGIHASGTDPATAEVVESAGHESDHDLTVVIPAFNEESRLPWTLAELSRFLDGWGVDYRVLVADDGSTDSTATLTDSLGPRFSTISLNRNRGKGAAVRTAMLQATGSVVAFTDADLPYELSALRAGYQQICSGGSEVVFGARDLEQSTYSARRRLSRTIATWVFREVVKRFVSRKVTDTQCGLKLFSHRAAGEVFSRMTLDGFAFDAEVVFLTQRLGFDFCRIPVSLVREYASTLSLWRDTLPMLRDIVGLWWHNRLATTPPPARWPRLQMPKSRDKKQAA